MSRRINRTAGRDEPAVVRHPRGGGVASGNRPAAGTRQGPAPLQSAWKFPPKVVFTDAEYDALFGVGGLTDFATAGVYMFLRSLADFETGQVLGLKDYAALMDRGTPPKPQKGPRRPGTSYEQLRRILRELESYDLVSRDLQQNKDIGQLGIWLPHVSKNAEIYREKLRAQRLRQQEFAQTSTRRKPA